MRWLLHGMMSAAVAEAMRGHRQTVVDCADLAPQAPADQVLEYAVKKQLEILTTDGALAAGAVHPVKPFGRTLVYLHLEGGEVEQDDAIDRLFTRYRRLSPARLYTVTASRVKVRQLSGTA